MEQKWFETFFSGPAVRFWVECIPPEATAAQVDEIWKGLELKPGAALLDVPCGHGRHAVEFARRGCRVTGADLSAEFLDEARKAAGDLPIEWVHTDMRALDWEARFDAAVCLGNSFAYLSPEEAEGFLRAVHRALRPGGGFAMDTGCAAEDIMKHVGVRRWHQAAGIYMLSENRYDRSESRLDIDYTFLWDGKVETRHTASYVMTVAEIRRMFERAGFRVLSMTGEGFLSVMARRD